MYVFSEGEQFTFMKLISLDSFYRAIERRLSFMNLSSSFEHMGGGAKITPVTRSRYNPTPGSGLTSCCKPTQ